MEWCRTMLWCFRYNCEIVLGKCWILLAYLSIGNLHSIKTFFFFLFFPFYFLINQIMVMTPLSKLMKI